MKYSSLAFITLAFFTSGAAFVACASGGDSLNLPSGVGGGEVYPTGPTGSTGGAGGTSVVTAASSTEEVASSVAGSVGSGPLLKPDGGDGNDGGQACVMQCMSDDDCSASCPAVPTGANCCDTGTGVCYVVSTPMCPVPQPQDGGMMTQPY